VPGGFGTRALLNDDETLQWIRDVSAGAKLTTSVCTGALLLSKSGVLNGIPATTHWSALDLLESISTNTRVVRDSRFVDSGKVITSAGVSAGIDMSLYIVERLFGKDIADETAKYIEYRR
jgi:transcriptional regulator GlxA family with amidase domain